MHEMLRCNNGRVKGEAEDVIFCVYLRNCFSPSLLSCISRRGGSLLLFCAWR